MEFILFYRKIDFLKCLSSNGYYEKYYVYVTCNFNNYSLFKNELILPLKELFSEMVNTSENLVFKVTIPLI